MVFLKRVILRFWALRSMAALLIALVLLSVFCLTEGSAQAFEGSVSAQSAVLIAADTGTILYEKDAYIRRSMASTTKIMTALLTLETAGQEDDPEVDITEEMVRVEGSSMGLRAGDRLTLTGLATGMLLASGNDAANAAALYLGGSPEDFAEMMNRRAAAIGMQDTHFVTPSGLDDDAHYSTAYDMALLAIEAMKNPEFSRIASSKNLQVEFLAPEVRKVSYTNHNKLLQMYEDCIGVKTGFTKKSGRCLVSAAQRDGITLVCVTLNAPDDWNDHIALLDYGFSCMKSVSFDGSGYSAQLPVVGGMQKTVTVCGVQGGAVALPVSEADQVIDRVLLPRFLYAPVEIGDEVGRICWYIDDKLVYSIPVRAKEKVEFLLPEPAFWEKVQNWFKE